MAGTSKKELNIDTFNEILFSAFKEQTPENMADLLMHEISFAYGIKVQKMEELIKRINDKLPYHDVLQEVNNIDASLDQLNDKLTTFIKEHPELKEKYEDVNTESEEEG